MGFNLWAWTWCNILRSRKSGTLGGGICGARCPGTFAFLEPKEFLEPVEPIKCMGFHRFQAFLGFKNALVSQGSRQVPWVQARNGSTGSTEVPWVQPSIDSTASRQVPWVQPRYGSTASKQVSWLQKTRGSTDSMHSLGSKTYWFHRVPDRFLGFKCAMVPQVPQKFLGFNHLLVPQVPDRLLGFSRGIVGIVEGVNFGNCPKYVVLNAPLCRTIFGMGGDTFLTGMPFTHRNHATGSTGSGSTGSRQVPWVQIRNGSTGSRQIPRVQTRHLFHRFQTGSLGSTSLWVQQVEPKEPVWNRPRHCFHRFQTGSLGSTVELWELWRVCITKQWFCLMYR